MRRIIHRNEELANRRSYGMVGRIVLVYIISFYLSTTLISSLFGYHIESVLAT